MTSTSRTKTSMILRRMAKLNDNKHNKIIRLETNIKTTIQHDTTKLNTTGDTTEEMTTSRTTAVDLQAKGDDVAAAARAERTALSTGAAPSFLLPASTATSTRIPSVYATTEFV